MKVNLCILLFLVVLLILVFLQSNNSSSVSTPLSIGPFALYPAHIGEEVPDYSPAIVASLFLLIVFLIYIKK